MYAISALSRNSMVSLVSVTTLALYKKLLEANIPGTTVLNPGKGQI